MANQQRKLRKDIGKDTFVRSAGSDAFGKQSTETFEVIKGEVLLPQPEPFFRQNACTVKLAKGGMISGVAYPGAFIDPITGNLHGSFEGVIPGQMVTVGFLNGNSAAPYVVNRYPYQGVANSLTEFAYHQPLTQHLYDSTDVLMGHFSGSIIRFNTGLISGKLPGSISVEAMTDLEMTANTAFSVSSLISASVSSLTTTINGDAELKLNGGIIQIKSTAQSMKTLIDGLIDILVGFKTAGSPTNHVTDPSVIIKLNAEKVKWAGLLEA